MTRTLYHGATYAALATIAAVVFSPTPARPQGGFTIERHCTDSAFYGRSCRTTVQPIVQSEPTAEEIAERAARVVKWEEFCKPTIGPADREGIRRYSYAHAGCEFGRAE